MEVLPAKSSGLCHLQEEKLLDKVFRSDVDQVDMLKYISILIKALSRKMCKSIYIYICVCIYYRNIQQKHILHMHSKHIM